MWSASVDPMPSSTGWPNRSREPAMQVGRQCLAGGTVEPHRREHVAGDVGVEHGGHEARGWRRTASAGARRRARRPPPASAGRGFEDRRGADRERERQRVAEAVGEEQLRDRQEPVVGASTWSTVGRRSSRSPPGCACAVHHALRHARRARDVEPEGGRVGARWRQRAPRPSSSNALQAWQPAGVASPVGPVDVDHGAQLGAAARDRADVAERSRRHHHDVAPASATMAAMSPGVSIVDTGTGTTPDRRHPRNQPMNAGSSFTISTTRSSRRDPELARARAAPATLALHVARRSAARPRARTATRSPAPPST